MITQLINSGFKDQRRRFSLCGLDLFASAHQNGTGKSAALESFKLAVLGELPGRAKTPEDILQFSSGDEIGVEVLAETESGTFRVERKFLRAAPAGEMRPIYINGIRHKFEEGSRWIQERIGACSLSFDPGEFLNLTPSKKRQWILDRSPEAHYLNHQTLGNFLAEKLADGELGKETGFRESDFLENFSDAQSPTPERKTNPPVERAAPETEPSLKIILSLWNDAESAESNLSVLNSHLKSEILRVKSVLKDRTAALNGLETSGNSFLASHETIGLARKELDRAAFAWGEVQTKLSGTADAQKDQEERAARTRWLEKEILQLKSSMEKPEAKFLIKKIAKMEDSVVDVEELHARLSGYQNQRVERLKIIHQLESRANALALELNQTREKLEAVTATRFKCPISADIVCDTDMTPYKNLLREQAEALQNEICPIAKKLDEEKAQLVSIAEKTKRAEMEWNQSNAANEATRREIQKLRERLAGEKAETSRRQGRLKACEEEAGYLQKQMQDAPPREPNETLASLESVAKKLADKKSKCQARLEGLLREQGRRETAAKLRTEKDALARELKGAKILARLVGPEGIQATLARRAAESLECEMNAALKWINPELEFVVNLEEEKFCMGWRREGKIIPLETMNSAHFILFMAPLLTALVNRLARVREQAGLPTLKALCIEAESLTQENLSALLRGLSQMKSRGLLDNVLVAHYASVDDPENLHDFSQHILATPSGCDCRLEPAEVC